MESLEELMGILERAAAEVKKVPEPLRSLQYQYLEYVPPLDDAPSHDIPAPEKLPPLPNDFAYGK
jgi:hypothetical protein